MIGSRNNVLKIHFLFTLGLYISFLSFLSAQDNFQLTEIKRNIYSDGITSGKLHELKHVFESDPLAIKRYNKFNNARKTQRILNFTGLGLMGAGAITSLVLISENRKDPQSSAIVVGILGIMAVGPAIIIISNPIAGSIKNKRKRDLLEGNLALSPLSNINNMEISLVTGSGRLGVVVKF